MFCFGFKVTHPLPHLPPSGAGLQQQDVARRSYSPRTCPIFSQVPGMPSSITMLASGLLWLLMRKSWGTRCKNFPFLTLKSPPSACSQAGGQVSSEHILIVVQAKMTFFLS